MAPWFPGQRISQIHGRPIEVDGRTVVPMYHPAAALHQASLRRVIEHDFQQLPALLAEVIKQEPEPREPQAVQMQLL